MSCQELVELLLDRLDACEPAVREHLKGCSECRRAYEELKSLDELQRALAGTVHAPAEFSGQVLSALSARRRRIRWVLPSAFAGLMFVGLGIAWLAGFSGTAVPGELPAYGELGVVSDQPGEDHEDQALPPGDRPYVDVVLENAPELEFILRLPSTIEIRASGLHDDFYASNVSH